MYEQAIRDLGSIFKGKRDKAYNHLIASVKRDPKGVVEDFIKFADSKAWSYAPYIFSANKSGVFHAVLGRRLESGEMKILQIIGYSSYIPSLQKFWNLYDEIEGYKREGIGVDARRYYSLLAKGKVKEALEGIRKEAEKGRELRRIKKKYEELLALAKECGEKIENVGIYIYNGDLEGAKNALGKINEAGVWKKVKIARARSDAEKILKEIEWTQEGKSLLKELYSEENVEKIGELKRRAEKIAEEIGEILQIYDDEEIRKLIAQGKMEEARKRATIKRGLENIKVSGEMEEIFTKSYNEAVNSVHGFEAGGKVYILDSARDKKLHVYDEHGNELFSKFYDNYVWSVHGFEPRGRVYILAGGEDKKLHVYDEHGNELFSKSYDGEVYSVYGFEVDGRIYILVGEGHFFKKGGGLHVYDEHGNELFSKSYNNSINCVHSFETGNIVYILARKLPNELHVYDVQGNELFSKTYDYEVWRVYGFKVDDRVYILAGGGDDKLHVYDEYGNELFSKSYNSSINSVHGFVSGSRGYILVGTGGDDRKLHVYDEHGNELFSKSYSDSVRSVHGFEAGGRVYILAGGDDKKLHVYAGVDTNKLIELQRWAESVGIKTNFEEIMEIAVENRIKAVRMAKELIAELERKRKEYEDMARKWREIEEKRRGGGIKVGEMPKEFDLLRREIERLKGERFRGEVSVEMMGEIVKDMWSKAEIVVENKGEINVEDVKIEISSEVVEIKGLREMGNLRKGEKKTMEIRIKSRDAGYVPVEMRVKWHNPLTEKEEEKVVYPEIFVRERGEKKEKIKPAVSVGKIREMYGLKSEKDIEKEYSWGEFSSYGIARRIGSGGFSDVYLVEKGGEKYAMKLPKGIDWKGEETLLLSEENMKSYGKEVEIWALLTERIPKAVVNLIDAGIHPFPWFVMELAERNLKSAMNNMDYEEKLKVAIALLSKLDKIHHFGVVHKDIKPENILYARGEWKFTDFGLSKILSKSSKSSQMISGTLLYMAPEQISHKKFGHTDWHTDIWQMGVLIYELLTGHFPFEGDEPMEIMGSITHDEPIPATEYGISEEIWKVIEKALKKKKEERWESAGEMKNTLERVIE